MAIGGLAAFIGAAGAAAAVGASAMENRSVDLDRMVSIASPGTGGGIDIASTEKNILDWLGDFNQTPNPAHFDGVEANLVGFVYRSPEFPEDTFMISRFVVSCCAADGTPVGLIVRHAAATELETDQWLEIQGTFAAGSFLDQEIPILEATVVQEIEPPRQPYLYP